MKKELVLFEFVTENNMFDHEVQMDAEDIQELYEGLCSPLYYFPPAAKEALLQGEMVRFGIHAKHLRGKVMEFEFQVSPGRLDDSNEFYDMFLEDD